MIAYPHEKSMRNALLFFLFALPMTPLLSQKMLRSPEWCAESHRSLCPGPPLSDTRSDSVDILHTKIELNLLNTPQILAVCRLAIQAKVEGVKSLRLDLEKLTVEEVIYDQLTPVLFSQSGAVLSINLPVLPVGESKELQIKYGGTPVTDASGWGGVYNQSGYTYNLGVGFAADPHSYGRAWFPCFDNFVERSTFEVVATSLATKPVFCNGYLENESFTDGFSIRTWKLDQPIPSYLACFAAGPYVAWKQSVPSEAGTTIPVVIAAAASDTSKVKATFKNLSKAVACFEHWYGPYLWNKIGYSLVPFNSGAMEHATNISIMRSAIDGSLGFETLWAHELSHHWWGDLATCSTAEDMWLNEGWASYSEHLFTEWVYGRQKYLDAVRDNFLNVLQNAHIEEGGYRAVSGVGHDLTYGTHVYKKGAVVAHNLRGYLGDSLFRAGARAAMAATKFSDWSSADFRDQLEAATGQNLHDFFEDWVFAGGYPDYSLDSVQWIYSPIDAPTIARVFVKQKLRGAPHFHHKVPLEFTFVGQNGARTYRTAVVSGENSVVEFTFNAFSPKPQFIFVNSNLKLAQARSEQERVIKVPGAQSFSLAKMSLSVSAVQDSAFIRVEHHFAMPDSAGIANPQKIRLTNRYWAVEGTFPTGFLARATINYDGRGQGDQLDTELFSQTGPNEDSILLLYRSAPGQPWTEYPTYSKNKLTPNDRFGAIYIDNLKAGQYTIGKGKSTVPTNEPPRGFMEIKTMPNPADNVVQLIAPEAFDYVQMADSAGKVVQTWRVQNVTSTTIDVQAFPSGIYWLMLSSKTKTGATGLVIQK